MELLGDTEDGMRRGWIIMDVICSGRSQGIDEKSLAAAEAYSRGQNSMQVK